MKTPDFKLVRITRRAAAAVERYTARKNSTGEMRANAYHLISEGIIEHIAKLEKADK